MLLAFALAVTVAFAKALVLAALVGNAVVHSWNSIGPEKTDQSIHGFRVKQQ